MSEKSLTLYAAADELQIWNNILEAAYNEETGEYQNIDASALEQIIGLTDTTAAKGTAISKVLINFKAEIEKVKVERQRLQNIERVLSNVEQSLKDYAVTCMQMLQVDRIGDTKGFILCRQRNSQVSVRDGFGNALDETWSRKNEHIIKEWEERFYEVRLVAKASVISAAWKADEPFPANVEIVEGEHIRVR
jgi:hypothetical protein